MSLASRLADLITAIGADIKSLQTQINNISSGADPWTYLVVTPTDVPNSTVTAADVTGLSIPSTLATGKYILEGKLFFTSAATTTGAQFGLVFPAQVDLAAMWQVPATATTSTTHNQTATATYSGGTAAPVVAPADSVALLDGVFSVNSAMASAITVQQRSEVAASAIVCKVGSFIRYRKIA